MFDYNRRSRRGNAPNGTASPDSPIDYTDNVRQNAGRPQRGPLSKNDAYDQIQEQVQSQLLAEINPAAADDQAEVRRILERLFNEALAGFDLPLSRGERVAFFERLVADVLGLGPIEPLMQDDSITEVLVNGPFQIIVERSGMLEETDLRFKDTAQVMRVIERIVRPLGRRVDESSPMVDARLADGSRVNIVVPPLSLVGPCISIRKFSRVALTAEDLAASGALTREMVEFLRGCVHAALNIVVSGGTSSGKTTFLNMLSSFIPEKERIITIEDAAELKLQQRHVISLEARPANIEGKGAVPIRQLVINSLRMRPDRIVVGECRGAEALDMLQAMNTGHDGSLTTIHSNGPRDTLSRVETMVMMGGAELPLRAIREQVTSAFDLVVHLERLPDGARRVVQITEVQGMEGDTIVMQDVFRYVRLGSQNGRMLGYFSGTGVRPKFTDKLEAAGVHLPPNLFSVAQPPPIQNGRNGQW